jgi:hypothetical protein
MDNIFSPVYARFNVANLSRGRSRGRRRGGDKVRFGSKGSDKSNGFASVPGCHRTSFSFVGGIIMGENVISFFSVLTFFFILFEGHFMTESSSSWIEKKDEFVLSKED